MQVTQALLPLLLDSSAVDPRIVNVASMAGRLRQLNPARQQAFASSSLTMGALDALVAEFETDVAAGKDLSAAGWGRSNCERALLVRPREIGHEPPLARALIGTSPHW